MYSFYCDKLTFFTFHIKCAFKKAKTNMNWLINYFTSSIGRKLIMSLTGLFLILFLVVHLVGNLQLLKGDEGEAFNKYSYFMTHNPLIKTISYGVYLGWFTPNV